MALGDAYLDVNSFKARVANVISDAVSDDAIESVLTAISRQIDNACGRRDGFNKSASAEQRFFDGWSWYGARPCFWIGDVVSVSAIASDDGTGTYPTVWDATTYRLIPLNAAARGRPYSDIAPPPYAQWWSGWPTLGYGIRVTGIWGWPAVPAPIVEATFLQASRLWRRKDAPFGVTGGGDLGEVRVIPVGSMGLDKDVEALIGAYRAIPV